MSSISDERKKCLRSEAGQSTGDLSIEHVLLDSFDLLLASDSLVPADFSCARPERKKSWHYRLGALRRHARNWLNELRHKQTVIDEMNGTSLKRQLSGNIYLLPCEGFSGEGQIHDFVTAFVFALREEKNATLLIVIEGNRTESSVVELNHLLHQLFSYKCRVVVVDGRRMSEAKKINVLSSLDYVFYSEGCKSMRDWVVEALKQNVCVIFPDYLLVDNNKDDYRSVYRANRESSLLDYKDGQPKEAYSYRIQWPTLRSVIESTANNSSLSEDKSVEALVSLIKPEYRQIFGI